MSQSTFPFKLFIFDFDGTLYDNLERSWIRTMKEIAKQIGISFSKRKTQGLFGKSAKIWIRNLFPRGKQKKALELFFGKERKVFLSGFKLFPDTKSLLRYLRKKGIKIAVATGLDRDALNIIFRKDKIGKFFDLAITAEEIKKEKPNPDILFRILEKFKIKRREAIFVGDSLLDIKTAKNAKIKVAIISRGAITDPKLAFESGADYVFINFSEFLDLTK